MIMRKATPVCTTTNLDYDFAMVNTDIKYS